MDDSSDQENVEYMNKEQPRTPKNTSTKFNGDLAIEIIDLEFREVEDWLKKECKKIKYECYEITNMLKIKIQEQI